MGDSPVTIPGGNAPGALATAGQTVTPPATPENLIPVYDKNGKQIAVTVNGVRATIQGYDKTTGKLHLTCADTPENRAKFVKSTQPKKDRTNEPSTDASVQFFRDSQGNPLTITVKNDALALKVTGTQLTLSQQEAEKAIKNSKRTLMHIVDPREKDKEKQGAAVNVGTPEPTPKPEYKWYKDWRWWAAIIGVLALTTIGILGFRKGGWWNKRKKGKTVTPSTTEETTPGFTPMGTEFNSPDMPFASDGPLTTQETTTSTPSASISISGEQVVLTDLVQTDRVNVNDR